MKNRIIAACFGVITAAQFALGMHLTVTIGSEGGESRQSGARDLRLLVLQRYR